MAVILTALVCYLFWSRHRNLPPVEIVGDSIYQKQYDSLLATRQQKRDTIYPFNPNYLNDYRGYRLGLSVEELDRLYRFRESGKWINSPADFQEVTQVSDKWLDSISPYFKFPKWVTNPKPNRTFKNTRDDRPKNLNTATAEQLQKVYGIGPATSRRIVEERARVGEFRDYIQLTQIYGLRDSTLSRLREKFFIPQKSFGKISLNSANRDELLSIPYFDDYLVDQLLDQRTLRDGFKSWDEVMKTSRFPEEKLAVIQLYLTL